MPHPWIFRPRPLSIALGVMLVWAPPAAHPAPAGASLSLDRESLALVASLDRRTHALRIDNRGTEPLLFEVRQGLPWVSLDPRSEALSAGRARFLTLTVEAWFEPAGDYADTLEILSNDPRRPRVLVPITIHQEIPRDPARATLEASPTVIGAAARTSLVFDLGVSNEGLSELALKPIRGPAWLSFPAETLIIPPRKPGRLALRVSADALPDGAVVRDTLFLRTNDPARGVLPTPIELRLGPPILLVTPDSLGARQTTTPEGVGDLTLTNDGGAPIEVELTPAAGWLSVSPPTVTLTAGAVRTVAVVSHLPGGARGRFDSHIHLGVPQGGATSRDVPVRVDADIVAPRLGVEPTRLEVGLEARHKSEVPLRLSNGGNAPLEARVSARVGWMSVSPAVTLAVLPGQPRDWIVNFHPPAGVIADFQDTLDIDSNDPLTPHFHVPVLLRVRNNPVLSFNQVRLNHELRPGQLVQASAQLRNGGRESLHYALSTRAPWVTPHLGQGTLPAYELVDLRFTFSAAGLAAGTYLDTLVVTSDDPLRPVVRAPMSLRVTNPRPPRMVVNNLLWTVARQRSQPGGLRIGIYNAGELPLDFTLTHWPGWATPAPDAGRVEGQAERLVSFAVEPSLAAGSHVVSLVIESNDATRPRQVVPVRFVLLEDVVRVEPERVDIGMPERGAAGRGAFRVWNISARAIGIGQGYSRLPGVIERVYADVLETGQETLVEVELTDGSQPLGDRLLELNIYAYVDSGLSVPIGLPVTVHVTAEPPETGRVRLKRTRPNPTAASEGTTWSLTLTQAAPVRIELFDATGRRIRRLLDAERVNVGAIQLHWDGRDDRGCGVAEGLYFLRLESDELRLNEKLTIVN